MEFVIYGRYLSHMGSEKIPLGFVKYGLGFVTYGEHPPYVTNPAHKWQTHLWRLRNGYIHIHIYISITEASKMGLSFMGGVCHIWGQRRYIWVLSNMGPIYSGTVMKYVANNYYMGFVTKVCHIWGVFQIWQIPPIYDKPLYSSVGREKTSSLLDQWESSILIMWPLFDQSQGSISGS